MCTYKYIYIFIQTDRYRGGKELHVGSEGSSLHLFCALKNEQVDVHHDNSKRGARD